MKAKETNVSYTEKSRRRSPVGKLALWLGALALTTCAVFAAFSLQGSAVACAESGCSGTYENGFCTADGTHHQAAVQNADGYYEIGNAGQLYWFAAQVNGGNGTINGKLTANITDNPGTFDASGAYVPKNGETARIWTPIGIFASSRSMYYYGSFDGNGKTISGLYYSGNDQFVGLFGRIASGAGPIKNLGIVNSAFNSSKSSKQFNLGGLAGMISTNDGTIEITGCFTDVRLTVTDAERSFYIGGLVGNTDTSLDSGINIANCCNAGVIRASGTGNISAGGLIGSCHTGVSLSDCYNTGSVTGSGNNVYIGGVVGNLSGTAEKCYNTGIVTGDGTFTASLGGVAGRIKDTAATANCYYLTGTASAGVGDGTDTTTAKTADEFASGAVAWLLNGEKADGVWKQNLTGDKKMSLPGFTGDAVNYDATNNTYYNTHNYVGGICADCGAECPHAYENGICADCGICQAATLNNNGTIDNTADDYYEIGNAGQLYWFAAKVNGGDTTINGKLTANITDNPGTFDASGAYIPKNGETARIWTPIGNFATSKATYQGSFDGNGKTISGLYYSGSDQYVGLFGRVSIDSAAVAVTIKNLSIVSSSFTSSTTTMPLKIGGLVGSINLVHNHTVMITGCYTDVRLTATTTTANICIGGLVGDTVADSENEVIVTNCCNAGAISANTTTTGNIYAGGLIGSSDSGVALSDCYNTGSVTGSNNNVYIGGVSGCLYGTAKNCYNTGTVTGSGKYIEYLGGVAGRIGDGAAADNCYYLTGTASTGVGGGTDTTTAKTADEFASGAVAWLLNGEKADGVWKQNLTGDKKMSLPGFAGEAVGYNTAKNAYYNVHNYVGSICADCGAECPHAYENGICADCGVRQAATLNNNGTIDNTADDYYEIGNLGNLYWFADKVNGGDNAINAKLTADIDVTAKSDFAIGIKDHPYGGVFDGDGHTLTVAISSTAEAAAPFSFAGGATFKNLTIAGTVATSAKFAGGFVGSTTGSLTFENCLSLVTINSTVDGDGTHGGFVGVVNPADGASVAMTNCGFIGAINGEQTDSCGGLFGWLNLKTTVTNSFVAATYTVSNTNGNAVARNDKNLTATNVYYLNMLNEAPNGATAISADQLTSGELTFKLGSAWKQTLGTDAYPNFSGEALYGADFDCTGKPGSYNNTAAGTVPAHDYVNGVCSFCHGNEVPTLNADGYYEIGNAGELEWFSAYVNDGHGNTNAILTADIDLSGITHTPIGVNYSDFAGVFDGKGFTIRNMKFTCVQNGYGGNLTYDYQGLFGVIVNGAVVKNFTIDGDIILAADGQKYIGGAVGLAYSGAKIENVTSYVDITDNRGVGQTGFTDIAQIGGVVGQLGNTRNSTSATAENCRYYGTINVNTARSVGGIAGQGTANSTVLNCVNYGTVGWNYIGHAGGVIGSAQLGTQVKNCANFGKVSIIRNDCVGGVAGYANDNVRIENCANYADIDAKKSDQANEPNVYLGGILGYVNSGKFAALTGCINYGKVTDLDDSYLYTGAIVGYINSGTKANVIQNNAYLDTSCQNAYGTNSSSTQPGATTSETAAQFASGEIAYLLNGGKTDGTQAWYQELTDTAKLDSYPVLSGKTVYYFTDCLNRQTYANAARQNGAHDYDANDICTVCHEVAPEAWWGADKNNLTGSGTLAEAIAAANATGSTIKYICLNKSWTATSTDVTYYEIEGTGITFDLNGQTVSGPLGLRVNSGSVTFTDSAGGGKWENTNSDGYAVVVYKATVTFAGGSYKGSYAVCLSGSTSIVVIKGGTFEGTGNNAVSVGEQSAQLTIEGGNFTGGNRASVAANGIVTIKGGTFAAGIMGHIAYWGGTLDLTGYPTTATTGTTALTDLTVSNWTGAAVTVGTAIKLPTDYGFYKSDDTAQTIVTELATSTTYAIKIADIVSVDITWTSMEFTYTDGVWNPETHDYNYGTWRVTGGRVTVKNTGNVTVTAGFDYVSASHVTGIVGRFTVQSFDLDENESDTTSLILSGKPSRRLLYDSIGTITVTIAQKNK